MITGTNRGIGLEFVRQYAEAGARVLACCRYPQDAPELRSIAAAAEGRVQVFALDVTDTSQIKRLATELHAKPIDILINNAGIYGQDDDTFGYTDEAQWLQTFRVNTIAPMKMMEAFVDHVALSRRRLIASVSSKMGSMADNGSGGSYVYRSSKAALNAVMKSVSLDLRARGITAVILHPGWVKTDMGGPDAEITPEQSVRQLRQILARATQADSGCYFDVDGTVIPW